MIIALFFCLLTSPLVAGIKDSDCLDCHSDNTLYRTNQNGRAISLFMDVAKLRHSVHGTNTCVSCHAGVTAKHPDDNIPVARVNCAVCHERQTRTFNASVHGQALKAGEVEAATCQDCHDSHEISRNDSPNSLIYYRRQAETCGACHDREAREWAQSVHGKAVAAGSHDAPTCTGCHFEHQIRSLRNAGSLTIAADVCSHCHASERVNARYNLPADRVKTFLESYHGLAGQLGSTMAANCASCHGWHKILPSSDTNSIINAANLVQTCGQCHPGAGKNFTLGRIHVSADGQGGGADWGSRTNRLVRQIYLTLIFITIGGMLLHNGIIFIRKTAARLRASARPVLRMSRQQRGQHFILAASFILLAITGFALRFPESWVAHLLGSHELFRRWLHRVSGLLMLGVGIYHLIYLLRTQEGRQLLADLFPVKKDLADVWRAIGWLAGFQKHKPKIGRFGYAEKLEYWAVVWGTIIMGVTGLMLWFNVSVTQWLPRWVVAVATTIHYYEAVLACLAIVVWHFYHVIFDPDVYPIHPAVVDGMISERFQQHEHALENRPHKNCSDPAKEEPPRP